MKYVDEFRQREAAQGIVKKIHALSGKKVNIMEICGTHTHAISKYGIRNPLPSNIRLISGPGCPVCVTSAGDINRIIEFCKREKDIIVATFGDMMRVPGTESSLQEQKATGKDIRVVYSPLGALDIARANPGKEIILYAVGFETTVPTVAATILLAKEKGIKNFSAFALHKLTPPAMKALLDSSELDLHGFLCPGHVTAIIGAKAYGFLAENYHSPCVVAGFEPLDAIHGLYMLIKQLEEGRAEIEIQYKRVVTWDGNTRAQRILEHVFEICDSNWRGIGKIPMSGLRLKNEFADFDAEKKFVIEAGIDEEPQGCACGEVLKGLLTPNQCPLFGKICTPESPVGPCMVSFEGTCAAYYTYGISQPILTG
ncbi:MAG: hydrogenase formation protein HypD [Candidatus Jettenia sp.]|uniref:Hydrogenase expression/formation protein n=1 Tax=Candidatus Jettenia caeni TaxID=247490 RepID=I3IGJ2_9BACT|nr:hydrogenase formation protein HypD [Candidatus Jettenia sp. AMX1]MBC6929796.1 hydrogenase formation protein HypD [Candidatus Jettenia sp.]NUN22540.1 hydrogenase formation protein HypD [Candidatus Jettenia caeni]KAA0248768.1 MAG: hydrogenase formation protein HypD [Candidatus Jettenia sp. AMX1]MCE7881389.1 hydrogenase formation protein HypD [Candidatus Jettenia sp. AMX1]MCQ3927970.1 hydrogenase formation protein HypD [Candidatus Jettenia sp.]